MNRKRLVLALAMSLSVLTFARFGAAQAVVFTGDAEADFVANSVLIPSDTVGEVGLPGNEPVGTISGWDIKDVRFSYDRDNDELFVGINFVGVGGDPDGDGDPANTAPYLAANFGTDFPAWGGTESFVVELDLDMDGNNDVAAGLDLFSDITGFQIATVNIAAPTPPLAFDTPLPGNIGILPNDTSAANPDIEFSIANVSTLPGATFNPDQDPAALTFFAEVFAGSLDDDGIGEDNLARHLLVAGKLSWDADSDGAQLVEDSDVESGMNFADIGILVSGISDSGNPGAFVNDYTDDPTTLDLNPNNGDFIADPYVLQTKAANVADDSDAGLLTISFVSPISGDPVSAHFAAVRVVDMEDAAGRGNGFVDFNLDGGGVCTELLAIGGDGNIQDVSKGAPEGAIDISSVDIKTGDADDSAAIDLVCWTYWELVPTTFALDDAQISPSRLLYFDADPGERASNNLSNIVCNTTANALRVGELTVAGGLNSYETRTTISSRLYELVPAFGQQVENVDVGVGGRYMHLDGNQVYIAASQRKFNNLLNRWVVISRKVTEFTLTAQ